MHAVQLAQRLGQFVVERRQDAVQDLRQVEHHVFALVGHGQPLAWMVLGLPTRGHLYTNTVPDPPCLIRGQGGVQAIEQMLSDALLFGQDGLPR